MLIENDRVVVSRGPKENRFRPSADALFRSAAYSYHGRVIGIVLSGALDDGSSGLWTIKRLGGITIVQDPGEATFDSMPSSALAQVDIDYCRPVHGMGPLISRLMGAGAGLGMNNENPIHYQNEIATLTGSAGARFAQSFMSSAARQRLANRTVIEVACLCRYRRSQVEREAI